MSLGEEGQGIIPFSTYIAAIRKSRLLFWILHRERHIFTSAHAPTASRQVHKSAGGIRDAGTIVEKKERERGDCGTLIPGTAM